MAGSAVNSPGGAIDQDLGVLRPAGEEERKGDHLACGAHGASACREGEGQGATVTVTPPSSNAGYRSCHTFKGGFQGKAKLTCNPRARPCEGHLVALRLTGWPPGHLRAGAFLKDDLEIKFFHSRVFHSAETILFLFWCDAALKSEHLISKISVFFFDGTS